MELQNFTEKTVKALSEYYGKEAEVKNHKIYKNNGVLLQGVCALKNGKNIAPTIYINTFWERYQNGEVFGVLIKEMIQILEESQVSKDFNTDFFMDYENVRKKLVLRLIHLEKNKELLKKVPYIKFQDLAIVCHCMLMTEEIGMGAIVIHKEHLKLWNVEEENLFRDAFDNSPEMEPYSILKMSEIIKKILRNSMQEKIEEICEEYVCDKEALLDSSLEHLAQEIEEQHIPMYVLTNEKRCYGAACLVYPGMLEIIAEKLQDDFYIIPSSVHEIIVVAKTEYIDSFGLNEMIDEVNRTEVDEEEWLSDHTYLYQRNNKKLISITNH